MDVINFILDAKIFTTSDVLVYIAMGTLLGYFLFAPWREPKPEPKATTTPCNWCGAPVDSDIHEEEMGMCLSCSDAYWTHEDEQEDTKQYYE